MTMTAKRIRAFGAIYAACGLGFAIAALAAHVLGEKMLDSMVQVLAALAAP
jgi:hypothetical protein